MTDIGYAVLPIVPSLKGVEGKITSQLSRPMASAGTKAGTQLGGSLEKQAGLSGGRAGARFGSTFKESTNHHLRNLAVGFGAFKLIEGAFEKGSEGIKVQAQTNAVLKSTGGVAGVTAGHVRELSQALSEKIGQDDSAIASAENLLLTFRNVRNELGKGNDVFDRATKASADLAAAMHIGLNQAAVQLGKALNDPARGMARLQRVGVTFTEQQKAEVKALDASGDRLGAQKVILKELETEFRGSAAAQATAADKARAAFQNLEEELGRELFPALAKIATFGTHDLIPAVKGIGAVVGPVAHAFGELPGPVKDAVVALIAFKVAQSVLGDSAVVTALKTEGAAIKQFAVNVASAETRTTALGVAALNLKSPLGKIGLGVAGFALLEHGAGHAESAVGKLETAIGGAGIGASFGPFGAAIGGAAGLLYGFARGGQAAAEKAKALEEEAKSLAATMDKAGQVSGSGLKTISDALNDTGALKNAKQLGIGLGVVVNAAAKGGSALDDLKNTTITAADGTTRSLGVWATSTDAVNSAQGDAVVSAHALLDAVDGQNKVVAKAVELYKSGKLSAQGLKDALAATGDAADDSAAKLDKLTDATFALNNAALEGRGDLRGYRAAIRDAAGATKDLAGHFRDGGAKADLIDEKLDNIASSANKAAAGMHNGSKRQAEFLTGARAKLIATAEGYGATAAQAKRLADQILHMPKQDRIKILLDDAAAHGKLTNLRARLDALSAHHWNAVVDITAALNIATNVARHDFRDTHSAKGNLFERHSAQISKGATRIWAEPETGGEAYIPLSPNKRQRSLDIWRRTGRHLGVQGFDDGGIAASSPAPAPRGARATSHRVVLDFGAGKTLTGWMQDVVDDNAALAGTIGRM
jgi:hypothetical protein